MPKLLIMVGVSAIVWIIFRRHGTKPAMVAFLLANLGLSFLIVNNVLSAGVERYDFGSSSDREFSIVYYSSQALFPFVIQKRHNWTARTFVHQVRFLNQNGAIVFETNTQADQSEYMHISLFMVTLRFCTYGILLAGGDTLAIEATRRWRNSGKIESH